MNPTRIFILYSERSGSNLLRLLLGNHPRLSAPVAPQFWDSFVTYTHRMGDLRKRSNALRLIAMLKRYANHPFSDWNLDSNAKEIYSITTPSCFAEVVDALYLAKAKEENKEGYVCKENSLFEYAGNIKNDIDQLHWIYLYRDPRDVVHSWLKNKVRFFTAYNAAHSWNTEQKQCLSLHQAHGFEYLDISYENMITTTEDTISSVLKYAELAVDKRCFTNNEDRDEPKRNILWKNLDKPIDSSNKNNYQKGLTEKQINIVESVCQVPMQTLGYELDTSHNWKPLFGSYHKYVDKIQDIFKKKLFEDKRTRKLISDRDELKKELLNHYL